MRSGPRGSLLLVSVGVPEAGEALGLTVPDAGIGSEASGCFGGAAFVSLSVAIGVGEVSAGTADEFVGDDAAFESLLCVVPSPV